MESIIVSTEWLAERLSDPKIKIIEVSSKKGDEAPYCQSHIPGAINFFWKDLCWHDTDRQFVAPDTLATRLGNVGISDTDTIVLYGDPVQYGTYAYWSLTMAGHPKTLILDGSRTKWVSENREVTKDITKISATKYNIQEPYDKMRLGRENLLENIGNTDRFLLDVRSPEEFSGERVMEYGQFDHGAERGGHIPGAKHLFYKELLNEDDTFKSPSDIKQKLAEVGCLPENFKEVVCYCRLSHRATFAWTAMTHILGYENIFIYDG
ncbi:MAG: Thiosulfate sulfurtransferase, partial [Alphaproteobacteria bacterium MarineAlpha3_Bin7]